MYNLILNIKKRSVLKTMVLLLSLIMISSITAACAKVPEEISLSEISSDLENSDSSSDVSTSESDTKRISDISESETPAQSEAITQNPSQSESSSERPSVTPPHATSGIIPTVTPVPSAAVTSGPTNKPTPTPKPTQPPYNVDPRNFDFNGPISKEVLTNFLSRAVTQNGFIALSAYGNVPSGGNVHFEDDFRMIKNIGAMFIGRAAYVWGHANEEEHYKIAKEKAQVVHAYNPKIILQACVFEAIYKENVNAIPVPAWVFSEFGLPVVNRNFNYENMLFPSGQFLNQWGPDASVPDVTRLETQMWFFYRSARYIDSGYEGIHLGQLSLISRSDSGKQITAQLIGRIRNYASQHARRKWVVLDAHIYSTGEATYQKDGKTHLLLDFHSFPLRPRDNFDGNSVQSDGYQPARLEKGFIDSIYGRSAGGIHPAGWETKHNPFLCEFDNSGYDRDRRDRMLGIFWPWGYDEITWFSRQPQNRRSQIITEFYNFINFNYSNDANGYGFLQMPTSVPLAYPFTVYYESEEFGITPFNNIHFFRANNQSPDSLTSFNLENTIKQMWRIP